MSNHLPRFVTLTGGQHICLNHIAYWIDDCGQLSIVFIGGAQLNLFLKSREDMLQILEAEQKTP